MTNQPEKQPEPVSDEEEFFVLERRIAKLEAANAEPACLPECHPGGYLHAIACPRAIWNKKAKKGKS